MLVCTSTMTGHYNGYYIQLENPNKVFKSKINKNDKKLNESGHSCPFTCYCYN